MLSIKNLYVSVEGMEILKGINLEIKPGSYALRSKRSGKCTLANVLAGKKEVYCYKGRDPYMGETCWKWLPKTGKKRLSFLVFNILWKSRACRC